jgi:hypothetical protein
MIIAEGEDNYYGFCGPTTSSVYLPNGCQIKIVSSISSYNSAITYFDDVRYSKYEVS